MSTLGVNYVGSEKNDYAGGFDVAPVFITKLEGVGEN